MADTRDDAEAAERLEPGTAVEVRSRFEAHWARGFEVAEVTEEGAYRIRRNSDGSVLPAEFNPDDVRPARPKKKGMWWV